MTHDHSIAGRVRDVFADTGRFRPCAIFDERLDCIRVVARDSSVTEIRIDNRLTVLEDNHPKYGRKYVGFTIKGARHFCSEQGVRLAAPVRLADILDRLVAASPEPAVGIAVNAIAKPLVEEWRIERVDLSHNGVSLQAA
jgi:hypothetical protein